MIKTIKPVRNKIGRGEKMKSAQAIGKILVGLWFLIWGILAILDISIPLSYMVLGIIAIGAGLMTLLGM